MANITWKMEDGSEISAEVKDGLNLMEAARPSKHNNHRWK